MSRDTRFKPGQIGNPAGRPKGIKDKRVQCRELFQENSEKLIKRAIEMAMDGDSRALIACLDRVTPKVKISADDYLTDFEFDLSKITTQKDVDDFTNELMAHTKSGKLPLPQAEILLNMCKIKLDISLKVKQDSVQEERMTRIEEKLGINNNQS